MLDVKVCKLFYFFSCWMSNICKNFLFLQGVGCQTSVKKMYFFSCWMSNICKKNYYFNCWISNICKKELFLQVLDVKHFKNFLFLQGVGLQSGSSSVTSIAQSECQSPPPLTKRPRLSGAELRTQAHPRQWPTLMTRRHAPVNASLQWPPSSQTTGEEAEENLNTRFSRAGDS